ncbi:hypothetical protein B0T17DRAFT_534429 [Bombardia bombarda]|uniref:Tat pathway signal sequence n=1 Tax=Bombardia bombarda TaxID=252184 RepID=A0AA39WU92_9PEZI|nr:hypothetical protein B0T17DRAFT_534429 [Bombardia bombarda]
MSPMSLTDLVSHSTDLNESKPPLSKSRHLLGSGPVASALTKQVKLTMAPSQSYQPLYPTEKDENGDGSTSELVDDDEVVESHGAVPSTFRRRHQKTGWRRYYVEAIVALLLTSNFTFAGLWLNSWVRYDEPHSNSSNCARPQLVYSPATSAIRYEKKRLWRDIDGPNPYTGSPRPEFDKAWRDLIAPMTIKVSGEELARFSEGDKTIAFKDGSGYIAEMAMYHELHCVKRVRKFLYKEHYYPNMTEAEKVREDLHMDHCLEYFRESAMCRGDTTLGTFFWRDGAPTSRVYTDNECVDFQQLDHWARQRMVDTSDYSLFAKDD